ncbi:unnamed protein product [Clonostachys rosea]|uniref:Protein kinase domain-containing protein n=1 Tax=Bionectria ochroleuca TaxID=29856 RepID=A0ABY6UFN8_BIOOC|nr:unnamed protein product [Clonostachys rosea]
MTQLQGTDKETNQRVAIKLEDIYTTPMGQSATEFEGELYPQLPNNTFPELLWTGKTKGGLYDALVTDLLGPSLQNLWVYCDNSFGMDTLCNIAIQALQRLKALHRKGIIHNDIKPSNLAMGSGTKGNTLYIIDYGLATRYEDIQGWEKVPGGVTGTAHYAPLEAVRDKRMRSYRDDLESLGLTLVELAKGALPWDATPSGKVLEHRERVTLDELCAGLPDVKFLLEHARSLRFEQQPNYDPLIRRFQRRRSEPGKGKTWVFDWVRRRYERMQEKMEKREADMEMERQAQMEIGEREAHVENRRRSRDEEDDGEEEAPPRRRRRQE